MSDDGPGLLDSLRGTWSGTIEGTNTGRVRFTLTPVSSHIVADGMLDDDAIGSAQLVGTGHVADGSLTLKLVPLRKEQADQFGEVNIQVRMDENAKLVGDWQTSVGTAGTVSVSKVEAAVAATSQPAKLVTIAATEKQIRVPSCVVDAESLKRILAALQVGATEAARVHHAKQIGENALTLQQLTELYRVTMILRGAEGELVLSADEQQLTRDLLPRPLQSIEFEIGFVYRASFNGQDAPNRATIALDFSRPPAFDVSNPSGAPTANRSRILVYGSEPIWVSGVFERVRAVLKQGAVRTGWIHGANIYDILVYVVGIPFALATGVLMATRIPPPTGISNTPFAAAIFVFGALTAVYIFRLAFSITRWLLPYVEFAPAPEPLHRKLRVAIATIVIGAVASLSAAIVWALFR